MTPRLLFLREGADAAYGRLASLAGEALARPLFLALLALALFIAVALFATFGGWAERKLIARIHSRRGPVFTGPLGLLQTVADMLKFLRKEIIFPEGSDRRLFALAPVLLVLPAFVALVVVPIGSLVIASSQYSLVIALALLSMGPIAMLAGAWASNSKFSTLGGLRSAGMAMSYEAVLALSAAGVALSAGTLDIAQIAQRQADMGVWFALTQPLAFALFLIAAVASVERNPFDLLEAESELVGGWKTEYGGVYFSLTLLAEYGKLLVTGCLFASLFLGGWTDAGGDLGFLAKVLVWAILMFSIRASAVRMRMDALLAKVWRALVPLALLNIVVTLGVSFALGGG